MADEKLRYIDKTDEEWEELVEKWHNDDTITIPLQEYLGLDDDEYQKFALCIRDENISKEDVEKKARSTVVEVIVATQVSRVCGLLALIS